MPRTFAALDLVWPHAPDDDEVDLMLAHLDDCRATALERTPQGARLFFASAHDRDAALAMMPGLAPIRATPLSVPDENWAERSQASITAVRVGRIVVTPPWLAPSSDVEDVTIVIQPSMGFGTGHHASTRLCLTLLQQLDLSGVSILDVGTGSGVLAIAACRLGARTAQGVDCDADALAAAIENVGLNDAGGVVTMRVVDIAREPARGGYDVLTANLTGGMLSRYASRLIAELVPGGSLIVSGFQTAERDEVIRAIEAAGARLVTDVADDDWVAALFTSPSAPTAR
jgi:ribosomal protein L11 methyltransferase